MNNYDVMLEAARKRFTQYDPAVILQNTGVTFDGQCYFTRFLGEEVRIDADTGDVLETFPRGSLYVEGIEETY